jgi:integrase/recombinase XerD
VQAFHVAAFIKDLLGQFSPATVMQHLAALRMLLDWLVAGHVLDVNPAHAVRGPKYVVKKGKTPVLTAEEARELLDSIAITRNTPGANGTASEEPDLAGLRDRALIGVMVYTFARVRARGRRAADAREGLFRAGTPRLGAPARKRRQGA